MAPDASTEEGLAQKLGVDPSEQDDVEPKKKKKDEDRDSDGKRKSGKSGEQQDDSELSSAALKNVDPPEGGDSDAGSSSLPLIIVLLVGTGLIIGYGVYSRRRDGAPMGGTAVRLGALGIVLVVLVVIGTGSALAAKRQNVPNGFFGVISQEQISPQDAQRMAAGGLESVRIPVPWETVQSSPSAEYDWSSIDASVHNVAQAGMTVLPIMHGTPKGFSNRNSNLPIANAKQKQGWASFLRAAVERYGPQGEYWRLTPDVPKRPIRTWQIWNEANFHFFATPVSPPNYLKLLKASRQVLKSVDPGSKIMLSGLFGSPRETPGKAMKASRFLDRLYSLGAKRFFDAVAIHPYAPDTEQLDLLLSEVREVMIERGARSTPMHLTEIGWGSDGKTAFGAGSLKKQAKQLTSAYKLLIKKRGAFKLASVYWFSWKDLPRSIPGCNFCYGTGLFRSGQRLKPKPAWNAMVRVIRGNW